MAAKDACNTTSAKRHHLQTQATTSDPGDLTSIADALGFKIRLYPA
jgi:hypothetical protein